MRTVHLSPQADQDIDKQFAYLAEQASLDVALRLLEATQEAFQALVRMPEMGVNRDFHHPALEGLRMWPIKGFQHHLVFYRPTDSGIDVIRVLHAARDIRSLLDQ